MKNTGISITIRLIASSICMIFLMAHPLEILAADKPVKKIKNKQNKTIGKNDKKSHTKISKKKEITITGQEIKEKKENLLMKELKRKAYKPSKGRRFEIIFFISFPALLFLTYTLMEFYVSNTSSRKSNPERKFQAPHYFYVVSTSLITSIYIAYNDSIKAYPSDKSIAAKERKFSMPLVFIRF